MDTIQTNEYEKKPTLQTPTVAWICHSIPSQLICFRQSIRVGLHWVTNAHHYSIISPSADWFALRTASVIRERICSGCVAYVVLWTTWFDFSEMSAKLACNSSVSHHCPNQLLPLPAAPRSGRVHRTAPHLGPLAQATRPWTINQQRGAVGLIRSRSDAQMPEHILGIYITAQRTLVYIWNRNLAIWSQTRCAWLVWRYDGSLCESMWWRVLVIAYPPQVANADWRVWRDDSSIVRWRYARCFNGIPSELWMLWTQFPVHFIGALHFRASVWLGQEDKHKDIGVISIMIFGRSGYING